MSRTPAIGIAQLTIIENMGRGPFSVGTVQETLSWERDRPVTYRAAKAMVATMMKRRLVEVVDSGRYRVTDVGVAAANAKRDRMYPAETAD